MSEYRDHRDDDEFWREVRPRREPTRTRWFPALAALAVVISVPWYLPENTAARSFAGLPLWVWITLAASAGLAILTSLASMTAWRDDEDRSAESERGGE